MTAHRASKTADRDVVGKAYDARLARRLWRYARPHRRLVVMSLVLVLSGSVVQLVQPYLIKLAIDDHIAPGHLEGLGLLALLFLLNWSSFLRDWRRCLLPTLHPAVLRLQGLERLNYFIS